MFDWDMQCLHDDAMSVKELLHFVTCLLQEYDMTEEYAEFDGKVSQSSQAWLIRSELCFADFIIEVT